MELIKTVAKNSHYNVTKPFGRCSMSKGQLINAKSVKWQMFRISYWIDLTSTTVLKDSRMSRYEKHHNVPIAQDSIMYDVG